MSIVINWPLLRFLLQLVASSRALMASALVGSILSGLGVSVVMALINRALEAQGQRLWQLGSTYAAVSVAMLGCRWAAHAELVKLSEKTLARRVQAATGQSPIRLIQRRRLMMATHLIETTKMPIEAVAEQVGYRDSTTLRRLMRRELGASPSSLR